MKIGKFFNTTIALVLSALVSGCGRNIEYNPRIDPQRFAGEYSYLTQTLSLAKDGTYIKKNQANVETGTWSLQDFSLSLGSNVNPYLRVVEVDGAYQILMLDHLGQDPDAWDWSKVWVRVKK
jgi:hypothetical protein